MKWILFIILLLVPIILFSMSQLQYPLDATSQKIIEEVIQRSLQDKLFDSIWNDYFYHSNFIDSVDGYDIQSGSFAIDGGLGASLTTGAVSGNDANFQKLPERQNILRWDRAQRFRTTFNISSVSSITARIGIGAILAPSVGSLGTQISFLVSNSSLLGVARNGTNETQLNLGVTLVADTDYNVEWRYTPYQQVEFLVNDVTRGVITTNLPSASTTLTHDDFFEAFVQTNAAGAKTLRVSFYEFLQKR